MIRKIQIILLALLLSCNTSYGQALTKEDVKAAFIYHFINFTEWEVPTDGQYDVCIPDDRPLRETASMVFSGKIINNHKIFVKSGREGCHVLVSDNVPDSVNMLTIGPLSKGGMVDFRVVDHKLKFAVNMDNIKRSQLKISSQLLKMAILE
ncbi:MAG: YfiR family protein [Candidatus Omnitrophica bacterium]|nr:YfiR family protein [Candidatus Omnitrophota bacterium]